MSQHEDMSEQPRKKQRVVGPEADTDAASAVPISALLNTPAAPITSSSSTTTTTTTTFAKPPTNPQDAVKTQLEQEAKAGITVFSTDAVGFSGIVKKRYTDFLVNEILPNKQVLHLEDIPVPKKQNKQQQKKKPEQQQQQQQQTPATEAGLGEKENGSDGKDGQAGDDAKDTKDAKDGKIEKDAKDTPDGEVEKDAKDTPDVKEAKDTQADEAQKEEATVEERKNAAIAALSPADIKSVEAIFGETVTKDMCTLYGKVCARPGRKSRDFNSLQSGVIADKQKRTDAHITARRVFKGLIETMTGDDNSILIKACPSAASSKPRHDPRSLPSQDGVARPKGKVGWDELGGEHLHFTLYKENKDTMEVLYFIASQLKLAVKNFQFAGTKDRRGVTVQRVAAYRIPAERLHGINPRLRAARIGGFKYQPHGLSLGDLWGNQFTITLRDCVFPDAPSDPAQTLEHAKRIIDDALTKFQSTGFINYFGLQRFGTFSIGTDEIGKKMLQGDLEGACNDIISYSPDALAASQNKDANGDDARNGDGSKVSQDDMARAEALHIWATTQKMGAALDKLPRRFQAENAIIRQLGWVDRKTGEMVRRKDWQGALMAIPRNLRLMYVHAYQSLVWNMAAGKRFELYGGQVVEGDLVLVHEHKDKELAQEPLEDIDDDGEVIIRPQGEDAATSLEDKFERARALTKEEAESGRYTIFDLVLPLPGYDVLYPANGVGQFYKDFMASERGGKLDPMDMRRKWRDISLSGSYRKVMARPENVTWEVRNYRADHEQMVQTDLEKLIGKDEAEKTRSALASGFGGADEADPDVQIAPEVKADENDEDMVDVDDGSEKIAVVLNMQLGSSQYATMALRELTKGGAITFKPDFQGPR